VEQRLAVRLSIPAITVLEAAKVSYSHQPPLPAGCRLILSEDIQPGLRVIQIGFLVNNPVNLEHPEIISEIVFHCSAEEYIVDHIQNNIVWYDYDSAKNLSCRNARLKELIDPEIEIHRCNFDQQPAKRGGIIYVTVD